jgi:hypothetical protein
MMMMMRERERERERKRGRGRRRERERERPLEGAAMITRRLVTEVYYTILVLQYQYYIIGQS